jgi:hypothetical protein
MRASTGAEAAAGLAGATHLVVDPRLDRLQQRALAVEAATTDEGDALPAVARRRQRSKVVTRRATRGDCIQSPSRGQPAAAQLA